MVSEELVCVFGTWLTAIGSRDAPKTFASEAFEFEYLPLLRYLGNAKKVHYNKVLTSTNKKTQVSKYLCAGQNLWKIQYYY